MKDKHEFSKLDWTYKRLLEVEVSREGNEVTVIVPNDLQSWEIGILIDEALLRAGLHPNQLQPESV